MQIYCCSCLQGDYLKLFLHLEGAEVNEYTPWAALLCGGLTDIPHTLYSSGPGLVLEFHSGSHTSNATGFLGSFRFIDRSKWTFIYTSHNENDVAFRVCHQRKSPSRFTKQLHFSLTKLASFCTLLLILLRYKGKSTLFLHHLLNSLVVLLSTSFTLRWDYST